MKTSRIFLTFLLVLCLTQNPSSSLAAVRAVDPNIYNYFSDQECLEAILNIIGKYTGLAKHYDVDVKIAVYELNNKRLIEALENLNKQSKAKLSIILSSNREDSIEKIKSSELVNKIVLSSGKTVGLYSSMHLKTAIFKCEEKNEADLIVGSYNWTYNATNNNYENIIITTNKELIKHARAHFGNILLKTHSVIPAPVTHHHSQHTLHRYFSTSSLPPSAHRRNEFENTAHSDTSAPITDHPLHRYPATHHHSQHPLHSHTPLRQHHQGMTEHLPPNTHPHPQSPLFDSQDSVEDAIRQAPTTSPYYRDEFRE